MSAGFIGSNGMAFVDRLPKKREATDAAIKATVARFGTLREDLPKSTVASVEAIIKNLDGLAAIRVGVDELDDSSFFAYFSDNSAIQIDVIAAAIEGIDDKELARLGRGYVEISLLKEQAGRERAFLSGVFARDELSGDEAAQAVNYVMLQDLHTERFSKNASSNEHAKIAGFAKGEANTEVVRQRGFVTAVAKRGKTIVLLQKSLGYGGLIHVFNNYIIRGSEKYVDQFAARLGMAQMALDGLRMLAGDSTQITTDIGIVAAKLAQYEKAFSKAVSARAAGLGIAAIDKQIKISDDPALQAIERLSTSVGGVSSESWFDAATARMKEIAAIGAHMRSGAVTRADAVATTAAAALIRLVVMFLVTVLVLAVLATWIMARIGPLKTVGERIEGLAKGEYVFDRLDVGLGGDEIAVMAGSYNRFIGALQQLVHRAGKLERGELDLKPVRDALADADNDLAAAAAVAWLRNMDDSEDSSIADSGPLAEAFATLESTQTQLALQAETISKGNMNDGVLDTEIKGVLGKSLTTAVRVLRDMSGQAAEIAKGDLANELLQRQLPGELGQSFAMMIGVLSGIITEMTEAVSQLQSASAELSATAQEQQASSAEAAASAEETKTTMESVARSAEHIAELSHGVLTDAKSAQSNSTLIQKRIGEMSTHSSGITDILEMIKEIASKSDMLALNAALEGTKAGEAGRGFSLVASQMQRLAGQVMGSVKNISSLTQDIEKATSSSIMVSEEANKLAVSTTGSAERITMACSQQTSGAAEVSTAMGDIARGANENAVTVAQVAQAAGNLEQLAGRLQGMVSRFKVRTADA